MASISQQTAYDYLKNSGLSPIGAAGVVGNLMAESSLNPSITNGIGAFGLAQWYQGRKTALDQYAASLGKDPTDPTVQLGFLMQELSQKGSPYGNINTLNNEPTPQDAAYYFETKFEVAGNPSDPSVNMSGRETNAAQVYNSMSGSSVPSGANVDNSALQDLTDTTTSDNANSFPTGNDLFDILHQSMQIKSFSITNPIGSITQDAGAIALRGVVSVIGLIFIIFGLAAIVKKVT